MSKLFLAKNIYACISEGHLVFLDVKNGCYSYINRSDAPFIIDVIDTDYQIDHPRKQISPSIKNQISQLIKNGYLTSDERSGRPLLDTNMLRPTMEALGTGQLISPKIRAVDIIVFVYSLLTALIMLRLMPFRFIYKWHKYMTNNSRNTEKTIDGDYISRKIELFYYIAPFFYSTKDRCFLTSLAIMRYLRTFGINANLVIAVQMEPFHAHCWAQVGTAAVGEHLIALQHFRPILVI